MTTQAGVFALGTTDHVYLELDLAEGAAAAEVITSIAGLVEQLATTSGVNVVVGVRPSLWEQLAAKADVPEGVEDWTDALVGPDGFTMPATPRDLWLWIAGGNRTAAFDAGQAAVTALAGRVVVRSETTGWVYQGDRDLTGFIDGTENPTVAESPVVVSVPADRPGAGSTVLLFQLWDHDSARWTAAPVDVQERAMGRTKPDSIELDEDVMPADSHVARNTLVVDGEEQRIFRRNVAYGDIGDHGTVFVGFSCDQWRLAEMLRRMAGVGDGVRDALTRYVAPLTGAYYVVPSVEALGSFAPPTDDD